MRMSDFVVRDAIIPSLAATTKEGVIREMIESLRAAGQFRGADTEDIIRATLKRELLGSTGIGSSPGQLHLQGKLNYGGVHRFGSVRRAHDLDAVP